MSPQPAYGLGAPEMTADGFRAYAQEFSAWQYGGPWPEYPPGYKSLEVVWDGVVPGANSVDAGGFIEAVHAANVLALWPDTVCAGDSKTRLVIRGGFPKGAVIAPGGVAVSPSGENAAPPPRVMGFEPGEEGLEPRVIEEDPTLATMWRSIELYLDIPEDALGLYNVTVTCGGVQGYVMEGVLKVVKMELEHVQGFYEGSIQSLAGVMIGGELYLEMPPGDPAPWAWDIMKVTSEGIADPDYMWSVKGPGETSVVDALTLVSVLLKVFGIDPLPQAQYVLVGFEKPGRYGVDVREVWTGTPCRMKVNVLKLDLAATDLNGVVPDDDEEDPGAFVHFNVDDDDLSGTPDKAEAGPVVQGPPQSGDEDDLLRLVLGIDLGDLEDGKIILSRANANAQVWASRTKGAASAVLTGTPYAAGQEGNGKKTWDFSVEADKQAFVNIKNGVWVEGFGQGTCTLMFRYQTDDGTDVFSDRIDYTFIADLCGSPPTPANITWIRGQGHTNLTDCEWSVTGPASGAQNCIGFVIGRGAVIDPKDFDHFYFAITPTQGLWTGDNDGQYELADADAFFAVLNYVPCTEADAELVLYGFPDGPNFLVNGVQHAAKKTGCGANCNMDSCPHRKPCWQSKMGGGIRISHQKDQLQDDKYGDILRYYRSGGAQP